MVMMRYWGSESYYRHFDYRKLPMLNFKLSVARRRHQLLAGDAHTQAASAF